MMKRRLLLLLLGLSCCLLLAACGSPLDEEYRDWSISVSGDGIEGELVYSLDELAQEQELLYAAVYSTINNWPNPGSYAAQGLLLSGILQKAGVLDTAQTISIISDDGYQADFTRQQLLETPQYCYAHPGVDADAAVQVYPIIAFNWQQGGSSVDDIRPDAPCLIVGQCNYLQHNNPVFVEGVSRIVVSNSQEQWDAPYIWPEGGQLRAGESVKLQHDFYSLVKIHYTLDGSAPTTLSPMYNPSTYQPQLNQPLEIDQDTLIRAFVSGYGRADSEVVEFAISISEEE